MILQSHIRSTAALVTIALHPLHFATAEPVPASQRGDPLPQEATAADIRIMDRYIGKRVGFGV